GLRGRERLLGGAQLVLHLLQLRHLFGCRLAFQLRAAAQLVDSRHKRAPALVGGEEGVERLGRALTCESGAKAFRIGARNLEADHSREFRTASITWAPPSSSGPGQIQSALSRSLS